MSPLDTFDPELFKKICPALKDADMDIMASFFFIAKRFVKEGTSPCAFVTGEDALIIIYLMTAHLYTVMAPEADSSSADDGNEVSGAGGPVVRARIDDVDVSLATPPTRDMWDYWMAQSPFGQSILALLKILTVGGCSIDGAPERTGFRGFGGFFY